MSKQADVIRDMRRAAGLPIEDRSEEELLTVPERTPDFAIKEVLDLSGMNDYQPGEPPKR